MRTMKLKNILLLFSVVFAFIACNDDDSPAIPKYQASVMTPPTLSSDTCILLQADAKSEAFALSWTAYDQDELLLGKPTYLVQIDLSKNNFRRAQVLTRSTEASASIVVSELNDMVRRYNLTSNDTVSFDFRIITNYGRGNGVIDSTASNVFSLYITPYEIKDVSMREPLHLIGSMLGEDSWSNTNYKFVMFRANAEAVTDTYTGKFAAGSEFKFMPNDKLNGWDGLYGSTEVGKLTLDGGDTNIKDISVAGYYTVTANVGELTYTIEAYDVTGKTEYTTLGLIGDFNGWGAQLEMTQATYDPHIWYLDDADLPDGELKFRANDDWGASWGGTTFPYGGGTGDNIAVTAGKYYVKFNDLTGHYVFYAK